MLEFLYNLLFIRRDVDEIIPGLWLGNYKSALDVSFLSKNNINVIINCTQHIPFVNQIEDELNIDKLETYRIPVNDSLLECDFLLMQDYFKIIIPLLLRKYTIEKKKILIHCHAGKQRSAILTAALLKVLIDNNYIGLNNKTNVLPKNSNDKNQFEYICNYILSKRPQVFTYGLRINFEPTYKRFFKIY